MELVFLLVEQISSMVLMVLAGFVLGRKGLITVEHSRVLSCVCVYLVIPCSHIYAFTYEYDLDKLSGMAVGLICAILIHALYLVWSTLLKKWLTHEEQAATIYSNSGNLVIPMIQYVLGPEYLIYSMPYVLVQLLLMWTHGQKLMGGEQAPNMYKIMKNPVVIGSLIGMILFFTRISLPIVLRNTISSISGCIAPLSMLVTGVGMSGLNLKKMVLSGRPYLITVLRLVIFPLSIIPILLLVNRMVPHIDSSNILIVCLFCTAGPVASTITQMATLYHNPNVGYVSSINTLSTLFCVVTMPLLSMVILAF